MSFACLQCREAARLRIREILVGRSAHQLVTRNLAAFSPLLYDVAGAVPLFGHPSAAREFQFKFMGFNRHIELEVGNERGICRRYDTANAEESVVPTLRYPI